MGKTSCVPAKVFPFSPGSLGSVTGGKQVCSDYVNSWSNGKERRNLLLMVKALRGMLAKRENLSTICTESMLEK